MARLKIWNRVGAYVTLASWRRPRALQDCKGPRSVTRFRCNGELVTVETCSPEGTSLEDHLAQHRADVLARAAELGCG